MRALSDKQLKSSYFAGLQVTKKQIELGGTAYDLRTHEDDLVHPKLGPMFEGVSETFSFLAVTLTLLYKVLMVHQVQPNGPFLQEVVRSFQGKNTMIYRLPEGTKLPSDLVCLHEHTDYDTTCRAHDSYDP
ncbi:hypothetical protein F5146DRAFT_1139435 [Armillaria mellea]|nr:hypothetical protein F5146DRAFT_1139435 [Armillaria mellea]